MKKQRRQQPKRKKQAPAPKPTAHRRGVLRNAALIGGLVAIGGFFTVSTVMATIAEHDLSVIGQGVPVVVQVHDPQCGACIDLQRETRAALKAFDDRDLQYRVANVKAEDGAAFANGYGAPYTTLLLFDAEGQLRGNLHGVRPRAELEGAFAQLVAAGR
ncbi:TlpA family protein disulfide reductase [Yoonia sp. 2307UL14-13]|uniref:TlpA family protein disulfide reductase n=1 Tax=Yoonia sp. 2307UL14-13 TaxID=3126506 RepID=UPI0030A4C422